MKPLFQLDDSFHGDGCVQFKWQHDGNFVATSGNNGLVHVFDRHGKQVDEVALGGSGECCCMDWDKEGETLAILVKGSGTVLLYDLNSKKINDLETGLKDPTFLIWSKTGPQLAVATRKGGLMLYRKDNRKKVPVMGKHSGNILCGEWSDKNHLVMGSADNTISLSNSDGDTIDQIETKYPPKSICSATGIVASTETKTDDISATIDNMDSLTLAINMGGKTIMLYNTLDCDNPIELAFQDRYGDIVGCGWCGDDNANLIIGFQAGFVVVVSTDPNEIGEELYSLRAYKNSLDEIHISPDGSRAALCGDGGKIRVIDVKNRKEFRNDSFVIAGTDGDVVQIAWTRGGQILSIATDKGKLLNFLAKIPNIFDNNGKYAAYLSSLREVSIVDTMNEFQGNKTIPTCVPLHIEPTFLALGSKYVAVGMNNRAWFYQYAENDEIIQYNNERRKTRLDASSEELGETETRPNSITTINEQEYIGTVEHIQLNSRYAAILCSGRVYLHLVNPQDKIENEQDTNRNNNYSYKGVVSDESKMFPPFEDSDTQGEATCMALCENLLIYGTKEGYVQFYSVDDGVTLAGSELRHVVGIRRIVPNNTGTRIVVIDETGSGFLYNPIDCQILPIPEMNPRTKSVMWDNCNPHVFVTSDGKGMNTYAYCSLSINGPQVVKIAPMEIKEDKNNIDGELVSLEPKSTELPTDYSPILSYSGSVTCQLPNAQLGVVVLGSHDAILSKKSMGKELNKNKFLQNLALFRFKEAWEQALMLNRRPYWVALSGKAMEHMNIATAIDVWRQLGDAGMVMALEKIRFVEDKHQLAGHIAELFGDYAQAQELYLLSPNPQSALSMRRDLLHWDHALKLAETIAPEEIPEISVQYAQQLEFKGEYQQALQLYESAMIGLNEMQVSENQLLEKEIQTLEKRKQQCNAGVARMTLRVGNIPRGVNLAEKTNDKSLCRECADILVSLKQFPDAAVLYQKAELYEQAASIFIKAKNFKAAAPLMAKIVAPRLHLQFAKAKEAEKDYKIAAQEYERARDMDSVVRLYLDHLNMPEKAFTIVRHTQSSASAEMVARYCQSVSDFRGAIEFLLMAKRSDDAFDLATAHNCMEVFERALAGNGSPEEYVKIARYYETKQGWGKAGEFYSICGQYHKALKLFLQSGEPNDIDKAIEVVGKARNDMLTHTLIDFLMGETNGSPQPPNYIFRLYMALGNYPQAAKTAIIIARQEQDLGNYKDAHKTLYETHHELEARNIRVPQALRRSLLLLHSYLLVKKLVKMGDHDGAARMLIRVAKNISKFPSHVVPILTSTVIECHRAKLKKSSFEYASMLMRPEHRGSVDPKFKRKIEGIVRKKRAEPLEDAEEEVSECPYTKKPIPVTELVCPVTKNDIPYCIVTGRHMVLDDWCICPNSKMPALYSKYVQYLNSMSPEDRVDPMTGMSISPDQLERIKDPTPYLEMYTSNDSVDNQEPEEDSSSSGREE